ncbi:hypothetical protein CLPU_1c03720 [Gottschalkia purinilytica]|uniref:Adenylyltransferase AadA C-terminal domain-containing protein n=1 Tax=Gottschalkia purinilytica TaxID=1503 RepID=A0A0L0WFE4_GOTPU|nr:aminoglycoside adenylyltransferase domain-containing protein [Gottschalkia purinilytica]KNF10207.1 hypothetical protein CLPU_1c03720 [Gottschalkia purinilytica]
MNERIPNILKPLLNEYVVKLKDCYKDNIFGVYIYNSVALGAFDVNKSDIDILTIINRDFTNEEIVKLKVIHDELKSKFKYAKKMEGMYIRIDNLGKVNSEIEPYVYFENGKLHDSGYYDINYVTWWTLKNNGIEINSPSISELNIDINWNHILLTMNYNLNDYWKKKSDKKLIFLLDEWVEFSVLTLCRILFTLDNKKISSKCEALKYTMNCVPDDWKLLVKEAMRIRENSSKKSLYKSRIRRSKETKKFIKYIINYCNEKYELSSVY